MLRLLLLPIGLGLVGLVLVDLLWTTLASAAGAGPMTGRTSALTWRVVKGRSRGEGGHRSSGVLVVVVVLLSWIVLLWAGWLLAFTSTDGAVVGTTTDRSASVVSRTYFVGYTVFTLGNGDFKPDGPLWQVATVAASGTGLVLISLAITYLVPVTGAATDRRSLAGYVASLGESPAQLVVRAWNGHDFQALAGHLVALAPRVQEAGERHLTYPVLHFFGSSDRRTAAPVAIAVLHEALCLLRWGVDVDVRLEAITVEPALEAIGSFLDTLAGAFISPARDPLPAPDLEVLRDYGIPTVDTDVFLAAVDREQRRRSLLAGLLTGSGWTTSASFVTSGASSTGDQDGPRKAG